MNGLLRSWGDDIRDWALQRLGHDSTYEVEYVLRKLVAEATWRFVTPERPVFLWGAGRTGSYLLYDLMSLHPRLQCTRARRRVSKGLYGTMHHGPSDYGTLLRNPFPPIEGGKVHIFKSFPRLRQQAAYGPVELAAIRSSYRKLSASCLSRRRILDKDPRFTFLIEMLEAVFPDAQHVHCVRNPVAVAASYARRMQEEDALDEHGFWGWRPEGWQTYRTKDLDTRAAWLACRSIARGLENELILGERCIRIRYEDLVTDPRSELDRVLRFLDLDSSPALIAALPDQFVNYGEHAQLPQPVEGPVSEEVYALAERLEYDVA